MHKKSFSSKQISASDHKKLLVCSMLIDITNEYSVLQ